MAKIKKMKFEILTLFPESFESFLTTSIIGRAVEEKLISINLWNIRDFSIDKHKKVDNPPYGGGAGMVMTCQPLFDAIEYVKKLEQDKSPVIFFTPSKQIFDQNIAEEIPRNFERVILLCGHYEGIDQRVRDELVDREISMGNFVLTGGELPAQIFIDAISRFIPGVLGSEKSHIEESFSEELDCKIEYPHYTRPEEFRGKKVPAVLLSGHHAQIAKWRKNNCS